MIDFIQLEWCRFVSNHLKSNVSHGGIAINANITYLKPFLYHFAPSFCITLENSLFQDSYVHNDKRCSPGSGAVTMIKAFLFNIKDTTFTKNSCTAIKVIASNLMLEGQVNITNNSGSSGGGLLLWDDSLMVLKPNTNVLITNNSAVHTGGGITVESQSLKNRPMCFFQLSEEITHNSSLLDTVKVVLTDNQAGYAGNNLFGGSVDNCYLVPDELMYKNVTLTAVDVFNTTFINMASSPSTVTSNARKIHFCCNGIENCTLQRATKEIFPGESFRISVVPVGQLDGPVPASVRAFNKYQYKENVFYPSEALQPITHPNCIRGHLTFTVRSNRQQELISLYIQHEGDISKYITSSLYTASTLIVKLKPCPIGFEFNQTCPDTFYECKCICSALISSWTETECTIKHHSTITKPYWLWIGYIKDPQESNYLDANKYLVTHRCVNDYCSSKFRKNKITSKPTELVQHSQCQFNRTGILCGACRQNLSLILGSSECWLCSNTSLILILAFAVIGILLILFLTVCDLTISGGRISGLIFYVNIVHISDTKFIPMKKPILHSFLKIVIAWMNLDLGINTCFYREMDAYAKAWLQFAFPLYLWILSGLIVFLCNRYISVTRLFGTNSVRVLATVILLSFTKLLRAVITTFSCINVELHGNNTNKTRVLWANDPNIPCFQEKHIPLFIVGLIFSIVWAIFIVFLLFIQCWPRLRCCSRIQRLKPFTDSFTGPNTFHGRFWTGLLLLSRLLIAIFYGIYGNSSKIFYFYTAIAMGSICLLLLSTILPIYIRRSNNILEIFSLLNLLLVAFSAGTRTGSSNYKYVSVSLTLVVFFCVVVYHCWMRVKHTQCGTSILAIIAKVKNTFKKRELEQSSNTITDGAAYPRYCTFDEDREPLLASLSYHN